jgi:hypothetical protein
MKKKKILVLSALATTGVLAGTLGAASQASAAVADTATTKGDVTFVENTDPIDPVDPENPDKPIDPDEPNPGTQNGPLRIIHVSNFHFGQQKVTSKSMDYSAALEKANDAGGTATTYANSVQISDERGTNAGWKVQVKQEDQFTSTTTNTKLTGAKITLKNTTIEKGASNTAPAATAAAGDIVLTPDGTTTSDVATAAVNAGMGTQVARFGTKGSTAESSVQLNVPANSKLVKEKYVTNLTWILNDSPA